MIAELNDVTAYALHNWWLIFPLSYLVWGVVKMVMRDEQHRRTLNLIKAYADQGKEAPAELYALLKR